MLLSQPLDSLTLRLTLFLLLIYGSSTWMTSVPLNILCGLGLISPSLVKSRWLWICICVTVIWGNALSWSWIDNHKYLITYWTHRLCPRRRG